MRSGTFDVPEDFDPATHLTTSLARTPWRHRVSVLVDGPVEPIRTRLPTGLATLEEADGRVRVRVHAERPDWVPALPAGLDLPFVVEEPDALRDGGRALARRLDAAARRP